eukprot:m.231805 g.231805  ORF g.231805 m.231805 type:complete len:163 (-) comp54280_c0_seq3:116-604(-)
MGSCRLYAVGAGVAESFAWPSPRSRFALPVKGAGAARVMNRLGAKDPSVSYLHEPATQICSGWPGSSHHQQGESSCERETSPRPCPPRTGALTQLRAGNPSEQQQASTHVLCEMQHLPGESDLGFFFLLSDLVVQLAKRATWPRRILGFRTWMAPSAACAFS